MKVIRIKMTEFEACECYNHVYGEFQGDVTLCGEDHAGDRDRIITYIVGKITCPRCATIIQGCKGIKLSDISKNAL